MADKDQQQEQSFEDAFAEFTGGTTSDAGSNDDTGNDDDKKDDAPAPAEDDGTNANADDTGAGADDTSAEPDAGKAAAASDDAAELSYDDLLAMVPEDKREKAKQLVDRGRQAEHKLASEAGRQAALQRRLHEERQRTAQLEADLAKAKTPTERAAAQARVDAAQAKQEETEDTLAKEFPELSEPVNIRIEQVVKRLLPPAQEPAAKSEEQTQQAEDASQLSDDEATAVYTKGYQAIAEAIPDWQEAVSHESFQPWLLKQPAGLRAMAASEDPQDSIWLINRFKAALAEVQRRVKSQHGSDKRGLKEHVAPRRSSGPRTDGAAGATFEDHFNAFAAESERGKR